MNETTAIFITAIVLTIVGVLIVLALFAAIDRGIFGPDEGDCEGNCTFKNHDHS